MDSKSLEQPENKQNPEYKEGKLMLLISYLMLPNNTNNFIYFIVNLFFCYTALNIHLKY